MEKKYELTDETTEVDGKTLHRIRALRDFGGIKADDLGGLIEHEGNLSHEGNCWIWYKACVFGDARVYGNALVFDEAKVSDNAHVYESAHVDDYNAISTGEKTR
ncbi:hypothetical protein [Bartonella grahamii]|uniref:hypothetical protein n=1 Tax=Bartonella grahamii TaxID=33045 RepID=UPI0037CB660A